MVALLCFLLALFTSPFKSKTEGRGSNFFLFTDRHSLMGTNPLDARWTTGKGDEIRLSE